MTTTAPETRAFGYLSLFASFSTLICCALPSLLVLLGAGATVASIVSAAPWLVMPSRHKGWVFAVSGILLALNFLYVYSLARTLRAGRAACPPDDPVACGVADRITRTILWISAAVYFVGFVTAFVLGPVLVRVE